MMKEKKFSESYFRVPEQSAPTNNPSQASSSNPPSANPPSSNPPSFNTSRTPSSQPQLPNHRQQSAPLEIRPEDQKEADAISKFMADGCGCSSGCSDQFLRHHYELIRNQCAELSHEMLDITIMGQLIAMTPVHSYQSRYMHQGM